MWCPTLHDALRFSAFLRQNEEGSDQQDTQRSNLIQTEYLGPCVKRRQRPDNAYAGHEPVHSAFSAGSAEPPLVLQEQDEREDQLARVFGEHEEV